MVWGGKKPVVFSCTVTRWHKLGCYFSPNPLCVFVSNCMDFSDWTLYTEITHVVPFPLVVFDLM